MAHQFQLFKNLNELLKRRELDFIAGPKYVGQFKASYIYFILEGQQSPKR